MKKIQLNLVALFVSLFVVGCILFADKTTTITASAPVGPDLVEDIKPVNNEIAQHFGLYDLKNMSPAQRTTWLAEHETELREKFLEYAERYYNLTKTGRVTKVEFYFGSANDTNAGDGDGNQHRGHFTDELVAKVHYAGMDYTDMFLLRCLNGWARKVGEEQQLQNISASTSAIGTAYSQEPWFQNGEGSGFCDSLSPAQAILLAEKNGLKLYSNRISKANLISAAQARQIIRSGGRVCVNIPAKAQFTTTEFRRP